MTMKTNFPTINSWTTQTSWVVVAISSITQLICDNYTSFLIFATTCSNGFGLQKQNARHENKAGQTAGTNR